jgi:polyisoprenoid-binding protein YceI
MRTTRIRKTAIATLLSTVVAAGAAYAANVPEATSRITLAEASRLSLKGKSTMHDFSSTATRLQLVIELADVLPAGDSNIARLAAHGAVKEVVLTVPVEGLKSEKEGLDKNMYKALKASANPNIVFRLHSARAGAAANEFRIEGELEVAGQTQPTEITVRATECPEGIVLEGSKALLMSSFGIKPPSMFLGTLKTNDQIVIEWRLVLNHNGF